MSTLTTLRFSVATLIVVVSTGCSAFGKTADEVLDGRIRYQTLTPETGAEFLSPLDSSLMFDFRRGNVVAGTTLQRGLETVSDEEACGFFSPNISLLRLRGQQHADEWSARGWSFKIVESERILRLVGNEIAVLVVDAWPDSGLSTPPIYWRFLYSQDIGVITISSIDSESILATTNSAQILVQYVLQGSTGLRFDWNCGS